MPRFKSPDTHASTRSLPGPAQHEDPSSASGGLILRRPEGPSRRAVRVRAQWPGYYRGHRREGETFDFVPPTAKAELPKWLVPADEPAGHDPKAAQPAPSTPGVERDAAKAKRNRAGAPQGPVAKDAAGSGGVEG